MAYKKRPQKDLFAALAANKGSCILLGCSFPEKHHKVSSRVP
jgi:hypothetical protein